jgi:hypothetical protein
MAREPWRQGAQLIGVEDPTGSDSRFMFYAAYNVFGITFLYEIGTGEEFRSYFPEQGFQQFESFRRMSQQQFDNMGGIFAGDFGEPYAASQSVQSTFEASLRDFGLEDIPDWVRESQEAMTVLATAAESEWSEGRTWEALSNTHAFKQRFHSGALQAIERMTGASTLTAQIEQYYERESAITQMLHTYRGEQANVNPWYVGRIMSIGWDVPQIEQVLNAERILRARPRSLNRLNRLLEAQGMEKVTFNGFIDIMRGNASEQVFEVINDAFRREALREAGVGISPELAIELGSGSSLTVLSPEHFTEQARIAALELIANRRELGQYGMSRADVIRAAFGEGDASTEAILAKLYRERALEAEGFESVQAFIDEEDDLRMQGFSAL